MVGTTLSKLECQPAVKMHSPMEQALITLVPTLNTLPQELIDLSTSLLAQSRNKAASLKPEEEIGRTYACAHIAVERLRNRLDIDKVVARPPVAPRIYKKLYGYLDTALSVPATPRTNRLKDVGPVGTPGSRRGRRSALGTPVGTPSKTVRSAGVTPLKTPASAVKSVGSATASGRRTRSAVKAREEEVVIADSEEERQNQVAQEQEREYNLPTKVPPMVMSVCDALDVPQASSHLLAALSAILQSRGWNDTESTTTSKPTPRSSAKKRKRTSTSAEEDAPQLDDKAITPTSLPALLAAIALITTFTLRNTVIDGTAYAAARSLATQALEPNAPIGTDVDAFLHASKTEGWLELPWFTAVKAAATTTSIPEAQTPKKNKPPAKTPLHRKEKHAPRPAAKDLDMDTVMEDADAEAEEEDADKPGAGLRSGLGTMFQESVDWLSMDRRKEYRVWKRHVLQRCAEIESRA